MSQLASTRPKNFFLEPLAWLYSLWKFSRPHTIIGTSLSVLALYGMALATAGGTGTAGSGGQLLGAWLACLGGNLYIVGLNQLEDIDIDRLNKPHLPLAAGEFSVGQGRWIVGLAAAVALAIAASLGKWLLATVAVSMAIGTAYSLPPIRLKRFPFWAAFCILTVRGAMVNLGLFQHFREVLGGSPSLSIPPAVWTLTLFVILFSVAIAIFKDVPDLEGDREYRITTFTLLLGKQSVFNLSRWIVSGCYVGAIAAGIARLPGTNPWAIASFHATLLAVFWWRSQRVDLEDKQETARFYQFIWKLFFLEYLLFPAVCLL